MVLDRQAVLMFVLAEDVLAGVTLEECLWRPTGAGWTVHERCNGWFGELGEEPPDPPSPSLGWTMWHPIWWLSVLLAHSRDEVVPTPESVEWPGPEQSLGTTRDLWSEWETFLSDLTIDQLGSSELTKFPYQDERPFVHVAGWASMELVKNLSEMCQLRRIVREIAEF